MNVRNLLITLCILLLLFLLRRTILRKTATAVTIGTIAGLYKTETNDRMREYALGWDYVYTIDGEEYRKSQMMSVTFKLWKEDEMAAHIGEKLVVHYAPDHPKISWAETPEKRT